MFDSSLFPHYLPSSSVDQHSPMHKTFSITALKHPPIYASMASALAVDYKIAIYATRRLSRVKFPFPPFNWRLVGCAAYCATATPARVFLGAIGAG